MRRMSMGKFILAVCLVGFGVLLLLVNTGIISVKITEAISFCYPFLFVLLGIWWTIEALVTRGRRGSGFWGIFFLIFGGLLAAGRLGLIDFTFDMFWKLWPLLLVYIGFQILTGHKMRIIVDSRRKGGHGSKRRPGRRGHLVSDVSYKDLNWPVEPMDHWAGVADYHFDFTKTFIPDKETKIRLSGWVGDLKILIPADVEFSVEGQASVEDIRIGDYKEDYTGVRKEFFYKTEGYDEAIRKLSFDFNFKVLDLRVDRV